MLTILIRSLRLSIFLQLRNSKLKVLRLIIVATQIVLNPSLVGVGYSVGPMLHAQSFTIFPQTCIAGGHVKMCTTTDLCLGC